MTRDTQTSPENPRLIRQLIDDSSAAIYVCDEETYELFYVNQKAAKMCGKSVEAARGVPCYAYFKGRDKPCTPCYMDTSNAQNYTEREYSSDASGRHYMTRGKIIDWGGRRALVEYLTDETERINAQRGLRDLINGIPSGVGIFNYYPDGRLELVYMNDGYYAMLGVPRAQRTQYERFSALNALNPLDRDGMMAQMKTIVRENHIGTCDIRVRIGEDGYRWLNTKARVAYVTDDHCTIYASYSDIDQEKQALLRLEESQRESRLRYMHELQLRHELICDAVIYYQVNLTTGVIEEYYSRYQDVPQMRANIVADEGVREGILKNIAPEHRALVRGTLFTKALKEADARGETSVECTYRRKLAGQGWRWVRATVSIMRRPGSDEAIAFLYSYDVDTQKKDQIAMQSVMDEEVDSIVILNAATGLARMVKTKEDLISGRKEQPFSHAEHMAKIVLRHVVSEDQARCEDFFRTENLVRALEQEPSTMCVYRIINARGDVAHMRSRAFYLDEAREDIVLVRRNITQLYNNQLRQQKALQEAADEANKANRAKSEFLSRMSHDIRTPLTAILALSDKELLGGATAAQKEESLEKIHSSGEYLLGILNDVLDMSRIESSKLVLRPEPYAIRDFRSMIETVVGERCRKKGVRFLFVAKGMTVQWINVDKVRFNQLFVNLLTNAVKFTPAGGTVEMLIRRLSAGDGCVVDRFIVRDSGIGMSAAFLPHAFDSFAQEHKKNESENDQGTGLGLSIVKQIVELMHGSISVQSQENKGTEFTVDLPLEIAAEPDLPAAAAPDPRQLEGLKILLCEDHPLNTRIVCNMLEKRGVAVTSARDGREGLHCFRDAEVGYFDAILMDIRMPNMDGLEATKAIRALARPDARTIPIIALTADVFTEDTELSMGVGMNGHVSKPIAPKVLYETIARLVEPKD